MLKNYLLLVSSFLGACLGAQEVHSALQLRNSHLWRGIEVSAGFIYTGNLRLDCKNFYAGFWAGGNFDGSYKEFNNYIGYKNKHLTLELWDIYNFSPGATYNNKEFFNYSAKETGRFWDFRSYYTISDQFPLVLSWNTVVFGRDRNRENTGNKYSSFVSGEYPVYKKDNLEVRGRVGYAFALDSHGEKNNFFAKDSGFNEVSLIVSKSFTIEGYKIPIGIWGMWNPVNNNAFLQFSVQVYSF
ncbi:hypothetical protein CQ046_14325 [Chryseobacterium sp. MYb7]|uniref:hypothetical protein n=1 Tax=Chryseobacterium sp. MYb7 TaxID=1827290 RepID=UPI000CFF1F8B|nr:hypothetical protein [Chryseobacterium sp. MYb7]PRB01871.1 hypothetical protein CQ046_14325 [Chryseobacterium sp. MYb7]